jgi:hypothetical protein
MEAGVPVLAMDAGFPPGMPATYAETINNDLLTFTQS